MGVKVEKDVSPREMQRTYHQQKNQTIKHEYKLHGHILKSVEVDKYLGWHIASDLA